MTAAARQARAEIARLAHQGLGVRDFSVAAGESLRRVVPFGGFCLVTFDPATLLPTDEVVVDGLPGPARRRLGEIELLEPDIAKFAHLSRSERRSVSLAAVTDGRLHRSRRHRELKHPHGFGDELRAALVGGPGTWGGLTLLRHDGDRPFTPAEVRFVDTVAGLLTEGLQRAVVLPRLLPAPGGGTRGGAPAAGVLLLDDDDEIEMADAAAEGWLAELHTAVDTAGTVGTAGTAGTRSGTDLPPLVLAVAGRARAAATASGRPAGTPPLPARARARTPSGRWLLVRGTRLTGRHGTRTAVTLEPPPAPELTPLVAAAYGLTDRELAVTGLVARGQPTAEIARRLHLAPYTVQDHLKAIFDKVGARTRGEVTARLYFDQP